VRRNPIDADSRTLLSSILLERTSRHRDESLLDLCEMQALQAVRLDPRTPHRWQHLGRVRLARSDPLGAYIAMARAFELYPIKTEYRDARDHIGRAIEQRHGEDR
jgi:cytochrome c-type biogenesis protein CcmH/NrfG